MITYELDDDAAQALINIVGSLPTSSEAYPLYKSLVMQYTTQQKPIHTQEKKEP